MTANSASTIILSSAAAPDAAFHLLYRDSDRALIRGSKLLPDGTKFPILAIAPAAPEVAPNIAQRHMHEFNLRDQLDDAWAAIPYEMDRENNALVLRDPGGELLSNWLEEKISIETAIQLSLAMTDAISQMHRSGILHKDIRPSNVLFDRISGIARLTGFGIASRIVHGRVTAAPSEQIDGTLAYMAPEQTGRLNSPLDSRSDLYSLGVTMYELFTGTLPFEANEPAEWFHSHLAKQAICPSERRAEIPTQLSAVIMKLLSKPPEMRYQTASGLKADLTRCAEEWKSARYISAFSLGERDFANQLRFHHKLYGRSFETDRLISAFQHVSNTGERRLALVSGYSGVGKSSLVSELRKNVAVVNGIFISGKFDQYKRDIPYAPLAEAFQPLIRDLLGKADDELARWRDAIQTALDINGHLMVKLLPEIELLIGPQAPVSELSGSEARNRLFHLLRQFIGVFARPGRPLVLFLDDLQWLDAATLDVFEALATQQDVYHLLLVGAYRDNEVDEAHQLHGVLESMRISSAGLTDIPLASVEERDIVQLLSDALNSDGEDLQALGRCVFEKTGGNPFFAVQFVVSLAEAGLLIFNDSRSAWTWNTQRILEQEVSDNIVDLMIERLRRLQADTLTAIRSMACIGNRVNRATLCLVLSETESTIHRQLKEALNSGLLLELDEGYAFAHDRIHEAAYAMISARQRTNLHARIGTLLLESTDDSELEAHIFDIVTHINKALEHREGNERKEKNAWLNLCAGRKARSSAAYGAACDYLEFGRAHLGNNRWLKHQELSFEIDLELAECTFLRGHLAETKSMVDHLVQTAGTTLETVSAYRLKIELHVVNAENERAVESGLIALRKLGIDLQTHPSRQEMEHEYNRVWTKLNERSINTIAELPTMVDPRTLAAMRLLAELWPPTYFTEFNLTVMVICRMVDLSLEHGCSPSTNQGFALLGWLMGPVFGRFESGYELTQLACNLVAKQNSALDYGRTCVTMALTSSWTEPLNVAIEWFYLARREATKSGDLYFACYCDYLALSQQLIRGHGLEASIQQAREYIALGKEIGFQLGVSVISTLERTMACLLGQTYSLTDFGDDSFSSSQFESLVATSGFSVLTQWYWTRKTMLFFLAGDPHSALLASARVNTGPWTRVVQIEYMEYHYYSALAICAMLRQHPEQDQASLRENLSMHATTIAEWADTTRSPTFADKPLLVAAEIAFLEGRLLEAEQLYEQAAAVAHKNGIVHCEALANELAAHFYRERGLDRIADMYLRLSLECYSLWGADAKVKQLVGAHPSLRSLVQNPVASITTQFSQIDIASVLKSTKAVSSELVLDQLLTILMQTVVEHAGAQRAVIVLLKSGNFETEAEAVTLGDAVIVKLRHDPALTQELPVSTLRFVARTGDSVIVDDALNDDRFEHDLYVVRHGVRSLLCLPVISHGKLQALLYLENNLAPNMFTHTHLEVLKLIAGQAAVSLENARLDADLELREAQIRRFFDANVVGIVFWNMNGQLTDANEAFLNMVGYDRNDLEDGLMRWIDMTPPEWQSQIELELRELDDTGVLRPIEKAYFHKNGTRVPVLMSAAILEGMLQQGIAVIVDLRKQKEAEAKAIEIERRNRLLHADLAHANRVATMGQLSAWIAHDVKQPLAGIVTSGNAGLRWLSMNPPDIQAGLRNFQRVVDDGMRAADILDKIRALVRKSLPESELIDINSIIMETLELVALEASRETILIDTRLHAEPLIVYADRTQIQQVLLNLLVNAIEAMSADNLLNERELVVASQAGPSGKAVISVLDTGPGLSKSQSYGCFDAFYSTKAEGLGLGLAICRSIIESFGGAISAAANTPRGAAFRFELPIFERGASSSG